MTEWRGGWLGWKRATGPMHPQENTLASLALAHSFSGGVSQSSRELRNDELELPWVVLRSQLALAQRSHVRI